MGTIIIDKSFLQGYGAEEIQAKLGTHKVLVTFELLYELATDSGNLPPAGQLDKLAGMTVLQASAVFNFIRLERQHKNPTMGIVDQEGTNMLRDCLTNSGMSLDIIAPDSIKEVFDNEAIVSFRNGLDMMWDQKFNDAFEHAQSLIDAKRSDVSVYLEVMGQLSQDQIGKEVAIAYDMAITPDEGWLVCWFERLRNYLAFHWRINGVRSAGLSCKRIANELMDLHYVTLLPWVDGIATGDKRIRLLVEAFFPNKLVL